MDTTAESTHSSAQLVRRKRKRSQGGRRPKAPTFGPLPGELMTLVLQYPDIYPGALVRTSPSLFPVVSQHVRAAQERCFEETPGADLFTRSANLTPSPACSLYCRAAREQSPIAFDRQVVRRALNLFAEATSRSERNKPVIELHSHRHGSMRFTIHGHGQVGLHIGLSGQRYIFVDYHERPGADASCYYLRLEENGPDGCQVILETVKGTGDTAERIMSLAGLGRICWVGLGGRLRTRVQDPTDVRELTALAALFDPPHGRWHEVALDAGRSGLLGSVFACFIKHLTLTVEWNEGNESHSTTDEYTWLPGRRSGTPDAVASDLVALLKRMVEASSTRDRPLGVRQTHIWIEGPLSLRFPING